MHDFCNSATLGGITPPPDHLRIMNHNFINEDSRALGVQISGAAPMLTMIGWHYGVVPFTQMGDNMINLLFENIVADFVTTTIMQSIINSLAPVFQLIAPDVTIGICTAEVANLPVNRMRSDQVKELTYHELSHTIHWRNVSDKYWIEEINYTLDNDGYGDGTAAGAGRPAIVEAWAHFFGATVANTAYGIQGSAYRFQRGGIAAVSDTTSSSFLQALEAFNPNLQGDDVRWIPKGIMHDLRDVQIEINNLPVNDNVSGFTIPQIFNALQNDVVSPLQYRNRLMQQTGNTHQTEVNTLFTSNNIQ